MTIDGTPKAVLEHAKKDEEYNAREVENEMYNEMLDRLRVKWSPCS